MDRLCLGLSHMWTTDGLDDTGIRGGGPPPVHTLFCGPQNAHPTPACRVGTSGLTWGFMRSPPPTPRGDEGFSK